jgi:phage terminase large subunit-like protein
VSSLDLEGMRELVADLRAAEPSGRARLLDVLEQETIAPGVTALDLLAYDWQAWARAEQLEPEDGTRWRWMLHRAGRGGGKTRGAAEMVRSWAQAPDTCAGRIALIAPTYGDIRITMVEGESGLLAISPPWDRPVWESSYGHAGRLRWRGVGAAAGQSTSAGDTCEAICFTAEKPDRVRGPQFGAAWGDEIAAWGTRGMEVHDLLGPALRLGTMPRCIYTTTPKPTSLVAMLDAEARREETEIEQGTRAADRRGTIQRVWATWANADNLPADTIADLARRYQGTTLGRQELEAALLLDDPDALWSQGLIDAGRVTLEDVPDLVRIVIGVDNAETASAGGVIESDTVEARNRDIGSNDTGIVGVGLDEHGHVYVLDDWSLNAKPQAWGERVVEAFGNAWGRQRATLIVVEKNGGGELIERNLSVVMRDKGINRALVPIKYVNATDGKEARAQPVHALYEQGRVHHVYRPSSVPGMVQRLADLEFQQTRFKRGRTGYKKDRVDALVWAITYLLEMPTSSRAAKASRRAATYVR